MSDKCMEHSDLINRIVITQEEHTKILGKLSTTVESIDKCLIGDYDKQGLVSLVKSHAGWFKWAGVIGTGIVTTVIAIVIKVFTGLLG